jgi:hypothetical protein
VAVVEDGVDEGAGGVGAFALAGREVVAEAGAEALAAVPAVVGTLAADDPGERAAGEVDLLVQALADVADQHVAAQRVEGEAVRVAEAEAPDFRRDWSRIVRIDPQDLPQPVGRFLGVVEFVVAPAAVAGGDVEGAVGAELELAAVVVGGLGVVDFQQLHERRRVGAFAVWLGGQFGDVDGAVDVVGVVDEEPPVFLEFRREGDRQQAALAAAAAAAADDGAEVGELTGHAPFEQLNLPFALDHEEPAGEFGVGGDVDRLVEFAVDFFQRQGLGAAHRRQQQQRHGQQQAQETDAVHSPPIPAWTAGDARCGSSAAAIWRRGSRRFRA